MRVISGSQGRFNLKIIHFLPARVNFWYIKELFFIYKEIVMNKEEVAKKMSQVIAKCWADEAFKNQLLADPKATLLAEGITFADDVNVKAVADSAKEVHLLIPAKPTDLSDEDLDSVAGGFMTFSGGGPNCTNCVTMVTVYSVQCGIPTTGFSNVPVCACL